MTRFASPNLDYECDLSDSVGTLTPDAPELPGLARGITGRTLEEFNQGRAERARRRLR